MGLISRLTALFQARMNRVLDQAEDPRETLDLSYEKQQELLQNVRRGIVEVVTSRRRVELQATKLRENVDKLDAQARQAVTAGREDLATLALQRKQANVVQLQSLQTQLADLENEQQRLTNAESRLAMKIEAFRTRKETIKAQYAAAEAQVKISEAVTGISEEMADVGMAIERAEEKTERLRARAGAIDELVETGTLNDVLGGPDALSRELTQISTNQSVALELEAMKRQLGVSQPRQLEEGKEKQ